MKNQPVRVLYAEDNPFERDNFISALEKCNREGCNFNVIVVETGKAAKEELMKPGIHFDLALLNDLMPDMNGEEILQFIKQSPDHKHIPVIMMIAGMLEDRGLLDLADDIYYKPIRINHIKNFTNFLNNIRVTREYGKAFWDCYNKLEHIADGTYGPIGTGRNKTTKGIVAIKVISLKELSPYEKDIFYTQVESAKFKKAPTTIQIEDIFMDSEYVHIVMEYVGPTLSKEIQRYRAQKQRISNEQILDWIAHLVIGLLWTHSEDGVQQDLSLDKILLASNNIAKLRPYEISSSLICSQTKSPYAIPPEVLKGGKYCKESDIWALGCVIYEMTALRKPFDSNSMPELIREICEDKPDLLPEDVDPIIKMLVSSTLQKDPAKRPSIWDIAEVRAIEKRILKLIDEHNCQKSLELFLNLEKRIHKIKLVDYWSERKPIIEGSEYLAQTIRNSIQFRTVNLGFLKTEEKVLTGEDLFNWFKKQLRIFDFHEVKTAINRMIHEGILIQLNEEQEIEFKNCSKVYYRFLIDNHGSPLNMLRLNHEKAHDPLALTVDLVKKMNSVLEEIEEDALILETDQPHIDFQMLGESKTYMDFNKSICALQNVSFENLEQKKIKACFLNIYQIMFAHQFLMQKFQCSPPKSVLSQVLNILRNSEERVFFYRISTMNFTVEDVFHSLFRVNKKAQGSILSRIFHTSDPRYQILQPADDPRVLFVLLPENFVLRKLKIFNCENLEEELDNCCKTYLREKIIYDPYENEIYLPEILRIYKNYFGKQKDIANFIFKYSTFEVKFDGDLNVFYQ